MRHFGHVFARNDAQTSRQTLQEQTEHVSEKQDPKELKKASQIFQSCRYYVGGQIRTYAESSQSARAQIWFDVSRIQIGDTHQEARTQESEQLATAEFSLKNRKG